MAIRLAKLNTQLALLDINKVSNFTTNFVQNFQEVVKSVCKKLKIYLFFLKENLIITKDLIEREYDVKVKIYVCNVSDEESITNTFDKIRKDFKQSIDILINNAAIVTCLPFDELENASIRRTFEVNIFSHFWSIKNVLSNMKRNNSGHIVAIASIGGYIGNANMVDYW